MGVEKYLRKIQEQEVIVKCDHLKCDVCGRTVTVNKAGKGPLVCCGQPMTKIGTVVEAGWSGTPKGWTKDSIKKFAKSLAKGGAKKEDFFDKCVNKMKDEAGFNEERAKGFCAGIKDEVYGSTYWRGKGKSPQEVGKDVKKHQNVD